MQSFLNDFFTTKSLSPHGYCLTWQPALIWTHVVADSIIGSAYFSIPLVLSTLIAKRRDIAYVWIFWFFAVFILACGTTHFMAIWTLWVPDYGLEAVIKGVTAVASIATAISLWLVLPQALALPSPSALRLANEMLQARVAERDNALAALHEADVQRRVAEDMLRQSQKMEAIGQLTGGVAHDFNNLLGVIRGNLEYLERRTSADERSIKSIRNACEATSRAATLVHKLLAFARKQPLLPVRVDIDALIREIMPLLSGVVQGSRIVLDLAASKAALVDPNQLENVLLNLIVNARDATQEHGGVIVRTRSCSFGDGADNGLDAGDYVMLEVEDTGAGMSRQVMDHAFEPFFTTKAAGRGTGLGLSQVFGFVRQSGGTACLRSEVGTGTCVTLFMPQAVTSVAALAPPAHQDLPQPVFRQA